MGMVSEGTNKFVGVRLVAVKPGVIIGIVRAPWPIQDAPGWARGLGNHFAPLFPKLSVSASDAVPISVVNLRSAVRSTEAQELRTPIDNAGHRTVDARAGFVCVGTATDGNAEQREGVARDGRVRILGGGLSVVAVSAITTSNRKLPLQIRTRPSLATPSRCSAFPSVAVPTQTNPARASTVRWPALSIGVRAPWASVETHRRTQIHNRNRDGVGGRDRSAWERAERNDCPARAPSRARPGSATAHATIPIITPGLTATRRTPTNLFVPSDTIPIKEQTIRAQHLPELHVIPVCRGQRLLR